ncbi:1276_t:CDS:2 [Acaulospora colombiana]|uniref:1276_t:CDS:1 n=1 Tax=Acaulospora colombiana TaxID=27376 RepID=A0ACA9KMJ8_9GLOM|nr:1276_t:CDS:2 [Acaulospora colombiana]
MSIDSLNPFVRTFWLGKLSQTLSNENDDLDLLVKESANLWASCVSTQASQMIGVGGTIAKDASNVDEFFCEDGFLRPKVIHRLFDAEVGEYFLTLDVILEKNVDWIYYGIKADDESAGEEPKNLIYEELGGGMMDLILDLFVHADGPRLRDRIAHGEANHLISSSLPPLYSYYAGLLVVLWIKYRTRFSLINSTELDKMIGLDEKVGSENLKSFWNEESEENVENVIRVYEDWISAYQSRFHPVPMLWKESIQLITNIWKCWNVAEMIEKTGKFVLGDWTRLDSEDSFASTFDDKDNEPNDANNDVTNSESLFKRKFLKEIVKEDSVINVMKKSCKKLESKKFRNTGEAREPIFLCQVRYTKEDAKNVNFQRVVIKKANNGVEKLHEVLKSIHSSASLSSRKRKNVQSLFTLLPTILLKLYFALFTLECLTIIDEQRNLPTTANQQKLFSAVLIFVERWSSYCAEGKWKDIDEVFERMRKCFR